MKTIFTLVCIIFSLTISAQIKFSASSDYSTVPVNSRVKVTYSLSGGNAETFTKPSFEGFQVVGRSSYSGGGGMQIIVNGQLVQSSPGESKWIFTLVPKSTGTYTIGPARVKVKGQTYSSNSISITVTNSGNAVKSQGQANNNTVQPDKNQPKQSTSGGKEVFLTAVPSKSRVYEGEQITVSYRLYTRYDISQYGIEKTPSMDGFWTEELTDTKTAAKTWEETIEGKRYIVGEIRKVALIAQKTGTLSIPSLELEAIVQIPNQQNYNPFSIFDQFFKDPFGSSPIDPFAGFGVKTEKRKIRSNPFSITVIALPEKGKPESFNGAVGNFEVETEVDRNKCFTGDAVVLRMKVNGNGNLPLIEYTEPGIPESFEWFDPDIIDDFYKTSDGISGTRTFEFLLQPTVPGDFTVTQSAFSFFNPSTGQYQSVELPEYKIKVLKGNGSNVSSEKILNEDIRHIHENIPFLMLSSKTFSFSVLYWIVVAVLILVAALILWYFRKRIQLKANVSEYRMRMAMRQAKRRLKTAKSLLDQGKEEEYYTELSKALWLYLTDKFTIPFSELSLSNAREILLRSNVPAEISEEFLKILDECEFTRFAPAAGRMSQKELYEKSADLIVKVQTHAAK
ncbi:MAG: BatD family protein [Bacteroidales bacterium]